MAESGAEEVSVGAEADTHKLELVADNAVHQHEVGFDVAVAESPPFALEGVVAECGRKRLPGTKQFDGVFDFRPAFAPFEGELEIADETLFQNRRQHGIQIFADSAKSSISWTLAKGP